MPRRLFHGRFAGVISTWTNANANPTTADRRPNPPPTPRSCTSSKIHLEAPEEQPQPGAAVPTAARHGAPPPARLGLPAPQKGWGGKGLTSSPPGLAADTSPGSPRLSREGGRHRGELPPIPSRPSPLRGGLLPRGHPAAPRPGRAPQLSPRPSRSPGPGPFPCSLGRWLPASARRRQLPASLTEPRPRRATAGPGTAAGSGRHCPPGGERSRSRPPSPDPDREAPTAAPRRGQQPLSAVPPAPTAAASSAAPPGPTACRSEPADTPIQRSPPFPGPPPPNGK